MPFITVNTHSPADHGAAFAAENATIAGSVRLEKNSSVWYGAVLRADTGCITIGENSNVQDNAVLHTGPGLDVTIGRGVSIGHGAIVHGCTVGDNCLIGMHATLLNGAVIGAGSLIACRDDRSLRHQRPGGNQTARADDCAVQNRGVHPN